MIRLSEEGRNAPHPRIVLLEPGRALAVWAELEPGIGASDPSMWSSVIDAAGASERRLIAPPTITDDIPHLTSDGAGNALITWDRYGQGAYAVSIGPDGTPGPPVRLRGLGGSADPEAALVRAGEAVLIWEEGSARRPGLFAGYWRGDPRIRQRQRLSVDARPATADVVTSRSGDAVVAWNGPGRTPYERVVRVAIGPVGQRLRRTQVLASGIHEFGSPVAAIGDRGHAVVGWRKELNRPWEPGVSAGQAFAAVRRPQELFQPPQPLSRVDQNASSPEVDVSRDGFALAAWLGEETQPAPAGDVVFASVVRIR